MIISFKERVGNNIKKYRKDINMTLKELADKIGLTEATVQKYEAGNIKNIDVEMLKKIADALEVNPEQLTEWESKEQYLEYRESKNASGSANLLKKYNQLTHGHQKAVLALIDSLLECQTNSRTLYQKNIRQENNEAK